MQHVFLERLACTLDNLDRREILALVDNNLIHLYTICINLYMCGTLDVDTLLDGICCIVRNVGWC